MEEEKWEFKDGCKMVGEWCQEHWKLIVTVVIVIAAVAVLVFFRKQPRFFCLWQRVQSLVQCPGPFGRSDCDYGLIWGKVMLTKEEAAAYSHIGIITVRG